VIGMVEPAATQGTVNVGVIAPLSGLVSVYSQQDQR
jgi:hypothetical protein